MSTRKMFLICLPGLCEVETMIKQMLPMEVNFLSVNAVKEVNQQYRIADK